MRKFPVIKTLIICAALVFCSCASSGKPSDGESLPQDNSLLSGHWFTQPGQGKLTVIGVSGRQLKPEMEIDIAREDAARKIAMYHGVQVVYEGVQNIGSGFLDYYVDSQITTEYDQEIEKYMDKLTFDPESDVFIGDGVVYVRFAYPAAFPAGINYTSVKGADGRPEWTTRRPQDIGNLMVGVGRSARQWRIRNTVYKSYQAAAADIGSQISTAIETANISDPGIYQERRVTIRTSKGDLRNFLVIETWIEPETLVVWTLAVAQKANY